LFTKPATRGLESDPVVECELGLRITTGLLFDAAVVATTFLVVGAAARSLDGETGGVCFSAPCTTTNGAGVFFTFADGRGGGAISVAGTAAAAGVTASFRLADKSNGGGGMSSEDTIAPVD
jgi:hypothetical protein